MSDWDAYEEAEAQAEAQVSKTNTLAERLLAAKAALDAADSAYAALCDEAISQVSDDFGSHEIDCGNYLVVVTRPEKYDWDDSLVDALSKALTSPPVFVKTKTVIDKRKFDAASNDDRNHFLPALTRKPGSVSIKVTSKGS